MNPETSTNDYLDQPEAPKKLPATLNVLTILTFIGCALQLYSSVSDFMKGRKGIEELEEARSKMTDSTPSFVRNMVGPEMQEIVTKSYENRIPLLIIGLISVGLCLYGAIEMRKLKMQGYYMWLIGELLPWICVLIFIGGVFFQTFAALFLIFPLIFILLYTLQRKHLVR